MRQVYTIILSRLAAGTSASIYIFVKLSFFLQLKSMDRSARKRYYTYMQLYKYDVRITDKDETITNLKRKLIMIMNK